MNFPKDRRAPCRAVLFDLDGVLVDSRDPIAGSINAALEQLGLDARPETELHGMIGDALHSVFERLLADADADPALAAPAIAAYREHYRTASVEQTRAFDGIAQALGALPRGLVRGVATSKPVEFAGPILEAVGLREHFAVVVGPSLAARGEDKTRTVARALEKLGVSEAAGGAPPVAAMVGDRHHDMRAGRALGLVALGVTWGIGSRAELEEAGAHHLITRPADLPPLFS
jgi:phosphoglycolate phosphatase